MELLPAEKAHAAVACVCVPGLAAVQGCVQARRKDGSIEGLAEPWDLEPRGSEDLDHAMQSVALALARPQTYGRRLPHPPLMLAACP